MIIGLCGKARQGKDTAGAILAERYGFRKAAFARALKAGCREIFGLSTDQTDRDLKAVPDPFWSKALGRDVTPREIMQRVGTDLFRDHFDPQVWVLALERRIMASPAANWVITDVRFPNEAEAVRRWGGCLVRVRGRSGLSGAAALHPSETALDTWTDWDWEMDNSGSRNALPARVGEMLCGLRGVMS